MTSGWDGDNVPQSISVLRGKDTPSWHGMSRICGIYHNVCSEVTPDRQRTNRAASPPQCQQRFIKSGTQHKAEHQVDSVISKTDLVHKHLYIVGNTPYLTIELKDYTILDFCDVLSLTSFEVGGLTSLKLEGFRSKLSCRPFHLRRTLQISQTIQWIIQNKYEKQVEMFTGHWFDRRDSTRHRINRNNQ
jgi:hypothetical protein